MYRVAILVASDSAFEGTREDKSGPILKEFMESKGFEVVSLQVCSDTKEMLEDVMKDICDNNKADLLLTSGGTGLSMRDCMPEATTAIAHRMVPGVGEVMRQYSMQFTKRAMFSRAIAATRHETLIINLPGSPKAVIECMEAIIDELAHGLGIMLGTERNCARK